MNTLLFAGLAGLLLSLCYLFWKLNRISNVLPPGPKPIPVLGNIWNFTSKELWLRVTAWAKQHGDVIYTHAFGQGLIFLNSADAAFDLLDKRGSIYSDKIHLVMLGDLCGFKNSSGFVPYGPQLKRQRRLINKAFGLARIPEYNSLLEAETRLLLQNLVADPLSYQKHIRRYAGGLTLSVVYGYSAAPTNDEFLNLAEQCVDILTNRVLSGGGVWPVDIIPALRHIPTWFPGAGFKRNAIKWKAKIDEFADRPYEYVKNSIKSGNYVSSFCSMLLQDETLHIDDEFEFDLKWTANTMYTASGDTIMATVSLFLLAMVLHPEVVTKVQKEIDNIVGSDRLPNFTDRPRLPYLECVMSESMRWGVPLPLNLPHRLMEDDMYRGMQIPKGSLVIGNIWAIAHDERIFHDPHAFKPERFMEKVDPEIAKKREPRNYIFGFGRRLCPGLHLADSAVWHIMASILATMDIKKAIDAEGKPIEPQQVYNNSIFRVPNVFKCDMRPRSEKALGLIKASYT